MIQEPGNRFIVKEDNKKAIIRHDEAERFLRRPGAKTERRADGNVETYYVRPDGVRIVTVVDQHGRLLRRYRRDRDGHEYNIIDNRRFYRDVAIGIGAGALGIIVLNLPPPRVTIPRDRYIVEYDRASDDDLDEALTASPLEPLERAYSLDEIRYTYELRARMRRIDLDTIIFDSGAWEVPQDQYYKLERMARAILTVLRRNPEAVFLIEGHTDAVGSDEDNLSLSDRRAQSIAEILAETFSVAPENLVTQGYGEQFLKIDRPGPEPRNRRVSIRQHHPPDGRALRCARLIMATRARRRNARCGYSGDLAGGGRASSPAPSFSPCRRSTSASPAPSMRPTPGSWGGASAGWRC